MNLLEQYKSKLKKRRNPILNKKAVSKRKRSRLWTHEIRVALFECVIDRFGSGEGYLKSKKVDKDNFSKKIAKILTNKYKQKYSDGGPGAQISWALTKQESLKHIYQASHLIYNKSAALDAGLIKNKDLDTLIKIKEK